MVSLRYIYDPTKELNQRLKIYLSINHAEGDCQKVQSALKSIITGSLRNSYKFQLINSQPELIHQLEEWVDVVCEIIKDERFPENQGYYIPYLFQSNTDNDMLSICQQLSVLDKKVILEITLQTCSKSEKEAIKTTIEQISRAVNRETSRYSNLGVTKEIYDQYLSSYVKNDRNLFKYSIKVLAESRDDIDLIVHSLMQNALKDDHHGQKYQELLLERDSEDFHRSLMATKKVELFTGIEREEWKGDFEQQMIKIASRSQKSGSYILRTPETEPLGTGDNLLSSTRELVKVDKSSSLGKHFDTSYDSNKAVNNPSELKLLHRLVTPQEISGLFRLVISGDIPVPCIPEEKTTYDNMTAEEMFYTYHDRITKDQYIVGINKQGDIVSSNWKDAPHRLVAGVTRSGKTNFLHWLIFQFLYVDPERKIYILDLKKNNFRFYNSLLPKEISDRIIVATDILECNEILKIVYAEYQRRQEIVGDYQTIQEMVDKGGQYVPRLLVLVDEAAMIPKKCEEIKMTIPVIEWHKHPDLMNLQTKIDAYLQDFATTGAGFSIHLMYCTQNPKANVITTQVTSQLEERLIFRIMEDTGLEIIGEHLHRQGVKIPKGSEGKGVAYVDGVEGSQYIYTPLIAVPPTTSLEQTLWYLL